jgi:hypothetical protein
MILLCWSFWTGVFKMKLRLVVTIGVGASAYLAHAGPINLLTSSQSSSVTSGSLEAGRLSDAQDSTNYTPNYWSSSTAFKASKSLGFSVADNNTSLDHVSSHSSLFGYAQSYGAVSVSNLEDSSYTGGAYNYVSFSLSSDSNVDLSIQSKADNRHGVVRRGARSGIESQGYVKVYQKVAGNFILINSVSNGSTLSLAQRWGAGIYAIEVGCSTDGYAVAGPLKSSAFANSYGYGVYSLNAQAVPEPTSMVVLALGCAALLRRRKKA